MSLLDFLASSDWDDDDDFDPPDEGVSPVRRLLGAIVLAAAAGGIGYAAGRAAIADDEDDTSGDGRSGPGTQERGAYRAAERGRGRGADSPGEIPTRGWKDILLRTYEEIGKDRVPAIAAGVTYYALLALFPAIGALAAIYGLFTDPGTIAKHFEQAKAILPYGAADIVGSQLKSLAEKGSGTLSVTFIFSLLVSLWSANSGTKALLDALNVAYDETEHRSFIKLNAVSLAFTLVGMLTILVVFAAILALPIVLAYVPLGPLGEWALRIGRFVVIIVVVALALAVLYRFGPDRREPQWRWVTMGSALAAIVWAIASAGLSFYASNFAHYDATYGSLGGVIGLMVWIWVSTMVILAGAELNAEIEHQTARDTTEGGRKPLGARDATMADTVGEAKG
jgi:membrane protein